MLRCGEKVKTEALTLRPRSSHTSRPSSLFPIETSFNCGAEATSLRRYATVSSYRGVVRKPDASDGVTHGSLAGTASFRLAPSHGMRGGRTGVCAEVSVAERRSGVSMTALLSTEPFQRGAPLQTLW
jgi:hypothetical protein